jgi:hypothetical protein
MTWTVTIDAGNIEVLSRIKGLETRPSSEEDVGLLDGMHPAKKKYGPSLARHWGNPVREINPIRNHRHWTEETLSANVLEF